MEINKRLFGIRPDEMERLTNETRKILLRSYLKRGIAPPFWVIAPNRPHKPTGEPQGRFSGVAVCSSAIG